MTRESTSIVTMGRKILKLEEDAVEWDCAAAVGKAALLGGRETDIDAATGEPLVGTGSCGELIYLPVLLVVDCIW